MSKTKKKSPPNLADVSFDYWLMFLDCRVQDEKLAEVTKLANTVTSNRQRYEQVARSLGTMPWWFVGLIHAMEASLNFTKHLHNGDPLTARTKQVPAGRPVDNPKGNPKEGPSAKNPYTWEESAQDALRLKGLDKWTDWTIRASLYKLEAYNGWGYRLYHPTVPSPYLWSYTNHYSKGKYAADGKWSANLVSKQPGAAAILRILVDNGTVFPIDYVGDFPTPSSTTMYA
jgi:lysozyme family protein